MGIPFELITMLGSGLLSGVMTLFSQNQKAKQEAFQRAIDGLAAQSQATDLARRYENKGFQITRRDHCPDGRVCCDCLAQGGRCVLAGDTCQRWVH